MTRTDKDLENERRYEDRNRDKRNKAKRDAYKEKMADPDYRERRLKQIRESKRRRYREDKELRERHIKKVNEYRKLNPDKYKRYYAKTNSARKFHKSVFEIHRLIIDIEREAQCQK